MAKYTYRCDNGGRYPFKKTIEISYGSDVPEEIPCICKKNMYREYKPTPIHFKGVGWGSSKIGEK